MKLKFFGLLFFSALAFTWISCDGDDKCEDFNDTFDSYAKAVVIASCATTGCHNGEPGSPAPLDYRTYAGIKPVLDNGKFRSRVLDKKDMPPAPIPKLTQAQLDRLDCWLSKGAPEK